MTKALEVREQNKNRKTQYDFMPSGENRIVTTMPDDTMHGEIESGEFIAIDVSPLNYLEDGIYAFWWDGFLMVKRLQFMSGFVRVMPYSKHYHSWEISNQEIKNLAIIGRVVASQEIRRH